MLMEQENQKIRELDELASQELQEWRALLQPRKRVSLNYIMHRAELIHARTIIQPGSSCLRYSLDRNKICKIQGPDNLGPHSRALLSFSALSLTDDWTMIRVMC